MTKPKRKAKIMADHGPPERLQHGKYVLDETMNAGVKRQRCESQTPCDRAYLRKQITKKQYDAAERLRGLWVAVGREPSVTAYWNVSGVSGASTGDTEGSEFIADGSIHAERKVNAAIKAVGKQLSPILIHTFMMELNPGDWAVSAGHVKQGGTPVLRLALDALVEHWGM